MYTVLIIIIILLVTALGFCLMRISYTPPPVRRVHTMKKLPHRLCFTGVARDVGKHLKGLYERIETLRPYFQDIEYFIYENDSTDQTYPTLVELHDLNGKFHFLSEQLHAEKPILEGSRNDKRLTKMAHLRDRYLRWLDDNQRFDYIVVLDWDLRIGFSTTAFVQSFQKQNWEILFGYGIDYKLYKFGLHRSHYYDALAFESYKGEFVKMWGRDMTNKTVTKRPHLKPTSPWMPVRSAFGGLGIYRADLLRGKTYLHEPVECEHIMLHRQIEGRKFINPSLVVYR
jgi:hypothetical protein